MVFSVEQIHGALTQIARRRAALDVEEAGWIRRALEMRVWERYGMVSILDYLERVVGYAPRTAADRVRVANELGQLPAIESALGGGLISYSAAKEITRVATRETESDWLDRIEDCNLRDVERAVSGREKGDLPDDPPKPHVVKRKIVVEVDPETFARYRQACSQIRGKAGRRLEDAEVFAVMVEAALERTLKTGEPIDARPRGHESPSGSGAVDGGEPIDARARGHESPSGSGAVDGDDLDVDRLVGPRVESGVARSGKAPAARHHIGIVVCEVCKAAAVRGAGIDVPVGSAVLEMACCDALEIGSLEGAKPERRRHTIPPAVRDFVFARDKAGCRVPGCRSTFALDIHHMIHQEHGGDHDPDYLMVACGSCHDAHHKGRIHISGNARDVRVDRPALQTAHVGEVAAVPGRTARIAGEVAAVPGRAARIAAEVAAMPVDARMALEGLGFPKPVARAAVADAIAAGSDTLDAMIRGALQSPHVRLRVEKQRPTSASWRRAEKRGPM